MTGREKAKRVLGVLGNVLMYLFLAVCLAAVLFTIFAKRKDGAVNLFGYEMRIVLSGSMEKNENTDVSGFTIKSIPVRSLVVIEKVPEGAAEAESWYGELAAGDVLTFRYLVAGKQETITHRIVNIVPAEEGFEITLRGDNGGEKEGEQVIHTADEASPDYVLGKVVFVSTALGNVIYILQQPVGIALVVMVPAAIVIVVQIIRIASVLSEKRREKEASRAESAQTSELEALKKRLADLERQQSESTSANGGTMSEIQISKTQTEPPVSEEGIPIEGSEKTSDTATVSEDEPLARKAAEQKEESPSASDKKDVGMSQIEETGAVQKGAMSGTEVHVPTDETGSDGVSPAIESKKEEKK